MQMSLNKNELKDYLARQLDTFFPDGNHMEGNDIEYAMNLALKRLDECFSHLSVPAYCTDDGITHFSHLHADQYAQFLYFFSNSLWVFSQNRTICDKIMYLNRILNNFMFSYKAKLPKIFFFGHPIGAIIGNAVYSDYLVISQNVTINTSSDELGNPAPVLGKGLYLGAGAKIIGNKCIGDRVSISVDTVVYNQEVESDKVVITDASGKTIIQDRKKRECAAQQYFRDKI